MKFLVLSLLALTFNNSAHAKLTMDKVCARDTQPPPYVDQDFEKLEAWLDAAVALAFANRSLHIEYDKEAFMKTCPNLALFNFGRATNCVNGLAERFAREDQSWDNRAKIKTTAAMKVDFEKAMEKYSKKFNVNLSTILPSQYPSPAPKKVLSPKPKTYTPDSAAPTENSPSDANDQTSAQ